MPRLDPKFSITYQFVVAAERNEESYFCSKFSVLMTQVYDSEISSVVGVTGPTVSACTLDHKAVTADNVAVAYGQRGIATEPPSDRERTGSVTATIFVHQ